MEPRRGGGAPNLVDRVNAWTARSDAACVLIAEWQRLEHALSLRARTSGVEFQELLRDASREAKAMRSLQRRIREFDQSLMREAKEILSTEAKASDGAIAKIRLGVRMHTGALDDDVAWALVGSGLEDITVVRARSTSIDQA